MSTVQTTTFMAGNSVALRLPRSLGVPANERFSIERRGCDLVLRPAVDPDVERRELRAMCDELLAIGPISDGVQRREPIEFPDRPGL